MTDAEQIVPAADETIVEAPVEVTPAPEAVVEGTVEEAPTEVEAPTGEAAPEVQA